MESVEQNRSKRQVLGRVVLVEGATDKVRIQRLFEDLSLNIIPLDGYNNLCSKLAAIKDGSKNFSDPDLTHILVVVDADENFANRKNEVLKSFTKIFTVTDAVAPFNDRYQPGTVVDFKHMKVGFFICPDNQNTGSLENLSLEAIVEDKTYIKDCVKKHLECLKQCSSDKSEFTKNQLAKLEYRIAVDSDTARHDFHYDKTVENLINVNHQCWDSLKKFIAL